MTAVNVPGLDYRAQIINPTTGTLTTFGDALIRALINRTGGETDKVDAAHTLASNSVPQGTQVVASGGLRNGNAGPALGGNIGLSLYHSVDAAANLPTIAVREGDWAYALDGRKPGEGSGAGTGVPVIWSKGQWNSAYSGALVTT